MYFNTNGIENSIQTGRRGRRPRLTLRLLIPRRNRKNQDSHNLKVKVARAGVSVRYRENYSASLAPAKAHARQTNDRPTMDQLLNDPLNATQLELFAETAPDQAHPGTNWSAFPWTFTMWSLEHQNTWVGLLNISFFVEGSKSGQRSRRDRIHEEQLARVWRNHLWLRLDALEAPMESCTSWRRTKPTARPGHSDCRSEGNDSCASGSGYRFLRP